MIRNTSSESDDAPTTHTTSIDIDPDPNPDSEPATGSTPPNSEIESHPDEPQSAASSGDDTDRD
jgi:hypothetical protein